ncbi:MAG: DUF349 domain-containing protein [Saccharospirillum sp.]|uniref:DUF349 domain-containing protein n=1 Tax=Saccharospirillum sp. TaxID=2033801 RepID=UPI0034A012DE
MVLSKFFGKKSTAPKSTAKAPQRPAPQMAAAGIDHWLGLAQATDPKQRKEAMVELAKALDEGQLTAEHRQQIPAAGQLSLDLHARAPMPANVSEELWVEVACNGFSARVRTAAAEQVTGVGAMEQLLKSAKGRDKSVYRQVKTRLEEHKRQHQALQAKQDHSRRLVEQLERHAKAPIDPLFSGKLRALLDQWVANSPYADEALTERWHQAEALARLHSGAVSEVESERSDSAPVSVETAAVSEVAEQDKVETDVEPESEEAANDPHRSELIQHLWQDLKDRLDQPEIDQAQVREALLYLTEQQHQWRQTEQTQRANRDEERSFHRVCTTFEASLNTLVRLHERYGLLAELLPAIESDPAQYDAAAHALDEWLHSLDWPESEPEPALKVRAERAVQIHHEQLAEHRKHSIQAVRQARGLIRRCQGAISEGHLKRASGLLQGIRDAMVDLKPGEHHGLFRQFEDTEQAVEKLRDWQSFAVLPKKEALIERMRHLLKQSLPPEDRARQIRDMQDEWRMLSRGLQNQHQALWETFHDLAQQAYEPCKAFFEEQGKLRALNLRQRQALAEQLVQYEQLIETQGLDLKELDRVLTLARNEWRRFSPVDRAANKAVQADFDAVFQRLRDRLQSEQQDFKEAKLAIIDRARVLLEEPDSRQATEAAKQLQREWQQAGHLARRDEQMLWKSFRAICDELFARREAAAETFKADLNAHKEQADHILADMDALLTEADPLAAKDRFEALKAQYSALGTLPKADYRKLQDQFGRLNQDYQTRCRDLKLQQQDQHWQALFDWNRRARFECDSAEVAKADWESLSKIPSPAAELPASLANWQTSGADDETLRRKTVELEILARADSPEADKTLRMALQVQRLTDGLGQQVDQSDIDRAVVAWLATPARDEAQYDALMARMKQARSVWMTSS